MSRVLLVLLSSLLTFSALAVDDLYFFVDITPGGPVSPGTTITYRAVIRNTGGEPGRNVAMRIPVPPGRVSIAPESDEWQCVLGANDVRCTRASLPVTSTAQGVKISIELPSDQRGMHFSAVATATVEPPKTFSQATAQVRATTFGTYIVRSTADSGPDTLRTVITESNEHCGDNSTCRILFDLPQYSTIELLTPLPVITSCNVEMRANAQITGDRRLEITGRRLTTGSGFEFGATKCFGAWHLEDLAINDFPDYAVLIRDRGPNVHLTGLFLGTDITGKIARPNTRGVGVFREAGYVEVRNCLISGNRRSGIFHWNGITHLSSSKVLGNGASGVFAAFGAMLVSSTEIAHNGEFGLALATHLRNASFTGSMHSNGITGIDWGLDGPSSDTDPRIRPRPTITDAYYDAQRAVTVVRGTFPPRSVTGPKRSVWIYVSPALNPSGNAEGQRYVSASGLPTGDNFSFAVEIREDLRGQIVTALVSSAEFLDAPDMYITEFSAGVTVR